jgi:hypothetical protein
MTKKLVCASFDKNEIGGFITINNGVGWGKNGHISRTRAVTREAFLAACKNRLLFNDMLGINIADGWQNAISDAISNFKNLTADEFNVAETAKLLVETDVKVRGEEAVAKDLEPMVVADEAITKELEEIVKKDTKVKKGKKNAKADKGTGTGTDKSGKVAGSEVASDAPTEQPSADSDAQPAGTSI